MAFAYLLSIDGIPGDSKFKGFENQIQLSSAQFGIGRAISAPTRKSSRDRESGAPSVSELTVTKQQDRASVPLFLESVGGEGREVVFTILSVGEGIMPIYRITLSKALVSGYSVSGGGDLPSESVSFNFTKIVVEHFDSETGAIRKGGYDIAAGVLI